MLQKNFNIYILFFLNSHAYYYTESKSNTWLSVSADFLLVEREHRLKDVIKTRKLQDRLNSTQEGHTYSLGSCFGFIGFVQALFFYLLRVSYETIKELSASLFVTLT